MEKPRRYSAYYFSLNPTGEDCIDKILSAICFAGKGYHHTSDWTEEKDDYGDYSGGSYEAWIENSAKEAAGVLASLKEQLAAKDARIVELEKENTELRWDGALTQAREELAAKDEELKEAKELIREMRDAQSPSLALINLKSRIKALLG